MARLSPQAKYPEPLRIYRQLACEGLYNVIMDTIDLLILMPLKPSQLSNPTTDQ